MPFGAGDLSDRFAAVIVQQTCCSAEKEAHTSYSITTLNTLSELLLPKGSECGHSNWFHNKGYMSIQLAVKTMNAIENSMAADQGAGFRIAQGQVFPHMKDAYQGANEGFRTHLGASVIGKECARQIWYGFRWALKPKFSGRMLRLFNRGHLEEARFIAMLLSIGCQVFQQDAQGNQFRISDVGGHFGGSGDGVCIGIPDIPNNTPCLLEFKTHGEKSFIKLVKEGVQVAKFEHYVQMQTYMHKMGLMYALYGAVNKNTDEVYMEIITLNSSVGEQFVDRGRQIIMMRVVPERINNASPGLFVCRYCGEKDICFAHSPMEHNCRTCLYSEPLETGGWVCNSKERQAVIQFDKANDIDHTTDEHGVFLSKERQLTGCESFYHPI